MTTIANHLATTGITQSEFARMIGVSQSMVYQMLTGARPVPEKLCVRIERETQGALSRRDLRPDDYWLIWPDLPEPHLAQA